MVDEADVANDFIDSAVSQALGKLRLNTRKTLGSKICTECGEDMLPERRKMGFQLCVVCAEESERRKSLFAG
jgi:RNA polymerase-binding transcription factor DksA